MAAEVIRTHKHAYTCGRYGRSRVFARPFFPPRRVDERINSKSIHSSSMGSLIAHLESYTRTHTVTVTLADENM